MSILKVFRSQKKIIKVYDPVVPSGLIAHTEKGYFYVKGNKRFRFVSERAMNTWGLPIISTREVIMSKYPVNGVLGFRDGSVVKDISDSKIYLISDSKRRHITEPDVLEWINATIIEAAQKEIFVHPEGVPLHE